MFYTTNFVFQFDEGLPRFHVDNVLETKLLKFSRRGQVDGLVGIDLDDTGLVRVQKGTIKISL